MNPPANRIARAALVALLAVANANANNPSDARAAATPAATEVLSLDAPALDPGPVRVDVHLPPGYAGTAARYPVLYVNDGQDMDAVALQPTLARLYAQGAIRPVIVVAVHMLPDRMGTYGVSDRAAGRSVPAETRYGTVGARAHEYSEWVAKALVPHIDARYRTRNSPESRAVLGWSLGALNAFNLGWQYPELFGRVGAFSPSFWLSSDRRDATAVQNTRLVQAIVDRSEPRGGLKLFFAVGSAEETDDRDGDGINDAIDDARDVIVGYGTAAKPLARGLAQLGYSTNLDHGARATRDDVAFLLLDGGTHAQASWARMLPAFLQWAYGRQAPPLAATGQVLGYQEFPSGHVAARNVDVWLPPGYGEDASKRYPVVYMHDGQNLFDPKLSYIGVDWGIDETMTRLIDEGAIHEAIVVGIWNTPRRFDEYMPAKAVNRSIPIPGSVPDGPRPPLQSDAYLKFLVAELKPFIDSHFRTRPDRDNTFVMGSSMGGLISLYAVAEYPQVFGGAAGISTHWPEGDGIVIDYLAANLPDPRTHKLYFDLGTATLDASYAPYQQRMDAVMQQAGYAPGRNWITRRFVGAEHSERAWRERVDIPITFLLGR